MKKLGKSYSIEDPYYYLVVDHILQSSSEHNSERLERWIDTK